MKFFAVVVSTLLISACGAHDNASLLLNGSAPVSPGFEIIKNLSDQPLEQLRKSSQTVINSEVLGNCGQVIAAKVELDNTNVTQENRIKQVLWNRNVESINVAVFRKIPSSITRALNGLVYGGDPTPEQKEVIARLKAELTDAVVGKDHMRLYSGGISGSFGIDAGLVAVIDETNSQLLAIAEGYCE